MGILGWATGGASGFGPSSVYSLLPFKGWKETSTWLEEAVDAIGLELDFRNLKFFRASARANLLDPGYTPGPQDPSDAYIANATTAPISAVSRDTMLDVLLYITLGYYPADTNLTIAQKQSLAQIGWAALRRKGTRLQILNLASKLTDGVAFGWTVPPFNFSIITPDGAPSPGWGTWTPNVSGIAAVQRPWVFQAIRTLLSRGMSPDWAQLGVGYSQFRWGYSSWGETWLPLGARINILIHEHFDAWGAGIPTGWTKTGTATLTQSTSASRINWEFTGNAAVLDLTAASRGQSVGLTQTASAINNQLTHRFQLDYAYSNAQGVATLAVQISEANADGSTYYWNPTASTWQKTAFNIAVPVSVTRGRFAIDIVPQSSSATSTTCGTSNATVAISALCDGTATTQTTYTLYRVGLYEKFNLAIEQAASGERTAWFPLVDAPGWTVAFRTGTPTILEPASADRSSYKVFTSNNPTFPKSAALSGRGLLSTSAWTNLIKGSNDFISDWTASNATTITNAALSPAIGEISPTAPTLTSTSTTATLSQTGIATPTSKSYVGGIWVRKITSDATFSSTSVALNLLSTFGYVTTHTLTAAQGWQLLPFSATLSGSDIASLAFRLAWTCSGSGCQIAVAHAYLYDVTGKPGVLYPPVIRTPVGSTATLNATTCKAATSTTDTNVLHPLTQRTLQSVVRGSMALVIDPLFDATSQPGAVIFDLAQGAAQNRVVLRINAGALELRRWDNAGNQWTASLTMTMNATPAAGSMTWRRNTAIPIRCIWDENSTMLSAGNGNASGTKPGSWAPSDVSVAFMRFGCDLAGANQFDGQIAGVEQVQLGAPTT